MAYQKFKGGFMNFFLTLRLITVASLLSTTAFAKNPLLEILELPTSRIISSSLGPDSTSKQYSNIYYSPYLTNLKLYSAEVHALQTTANKAGYINGLPSTYIEDEIDQMVLHLLKPSTIESRSAYNISEKSILPLGFIQNNRNGQNFELFITIASNKNKPNDVLIAFDLMSYKNRTSKEVMIAKSHQLRYQLRQTFKPKDSTTAYTENENPFEDDIIVFHNRETESIAINSGTANNENEPFRQFYFEIALQGKIDPLVFKNYISHALNEIALIFN